MGNRYKYIVDLKTDTSKFEKGTNKTMGMLKKVGGAAAIAYGAKKVWDFAKAASEAADVQLKAEAKLLTALKGREDVQQALIKQAGELQKKTLYGDEQTIEAASLVAPFVKQEEALKRVIPLIQDFASAKGMDLKNAADLIGKTLGSETNALSRYGLEVEGAVGSTERLDTLTRSLTDAFGGQAEAAAKTGLGPWQQFQNTMGDVMESLGMLFIPLLNKIGTLLAKVFNPEVIEDMRRKGVELVNWFIDLYNESMVFRAAVEYIKMSFNNVWLTVKAVFKHIWNVLKTTGEAIKNLFTFNFSELKRTLANGFSESLGIAKELGEGVADNFKTAVENTLSRKKVEFIPVDDVKKQASTAGGEASESFAQAFTAKPVPVPPIDLEKLSFSGNAELPSLEENLFDPASAQGNKNRLSAMLAELNGEFSKAGEFAKLYGDEITLFTDKQNILSDSIQTLIDEGYSVQGEAIQGLINMQNQLAETQGKNIEQMKLMQAFSTELGDSLMQTASQGAESFAEMGSNILNTIRQVITGYIAKGVAGAVSKAIGESVLPFPLNIIAAPTAAAMATTAFNSLVPQFADGGMVYGPTMGLMGEYPGARSNPEVIAPLDKLRGILRNDSSPQGGQVEFEIKGDRLVGVLNNHNRRTSRQR
jgi:hypothetical protein